MSPTGWTHAGRSAFQKSSTEVVLKQLHLPCDRGLRNVRALSGATEAALLKHQQKQTELFEHGPTA